MTDSMVSHWDACLGCMACVTACPSGVQYDRLIEQTRAQVERRHERTAEGQGAARADLLALPAPEAAPARCAARCGCCRRPGSTARCGAPACWSGSRRSSPRWRASPRASASRSRSRRTSAPPGQRRAVVGLLTGCVQGAFFPGVNAATARVLQAEGCDVVVPQAQGCCGALSVHNGREPEAQDFARALVDAFEARRRRARRGQRRRLRLDDEGVRRAAGRRPGVRRPGPRLRRAGPRRLRDPRRARPGGAAAPARRDRRLPRRLPPRRTPRASARSPAGCSRRSPGSSCARSPRPSCAAAPPASTTSSTPSRRASSATARRRTSSPPAPSCSSPPTPAA